MPAAAYSITTPHISAPNQHTYKFIHSYRAAVATLLFACATAKHSSFRVVSKAWNEPPRCTDGNCARSYAQLRVIAVTFVPCSCHVYATRVLLHVCLPLSIFLGGFICMRDVDDYLIPAIIRFIGRSTVSYLRPRSTIALPSCRRLTRRLTVLFFSLFFSLLLSLSFRTGNLAVFAFQVNHRSVSIA